MLFSDFKTGQVVVYNEQYRGIVTDKTYLQVTILWAVSDSPVPVAYNRTELAMLDRIVFYANWCEFNTVPVKTINTLNNF